MNKLAFIVGLLCTQSLYGQSIGVLSTLNMPLSARLAALGSRNVSLIDVSPAFFFQNPALASAHSHRMRLVASFVHHYADIHAGELALRYSSKSHHYLVGARYLSFGQMDRYDPIGQPIGTFAASETLFQIGYAYTFGQFRIGTSAKSLFSHIDQQANRALFADIGGHYTSSSQLLNIGLAIKNLSILADNDAYETPSPLDLWIGISAKTPHAPFRFSLTSYGWSEESIYFDPYSPTLERHTLSASFFDRMLSRFNLAAEINLLNRLTLMGSWNYTLRRNNAIIDVTGASGFAVGVNVHIWALNIGLAQSYYQVHAGATSHVSVAVNGRSATDKKTKAQTKPMNKVFHVSSLKN